MMFFHLLSLFTISALNAEQSKIPTARYYTWNTSTIIHEVYNAQHFDDIMLDKDDITNRPCFIVFYSKLCEDRKDILFPGNLPPVSVVSYLRYKMEYPNFTWFNLGKRFDLPSRFNVKTDTCLSVKFIPKGFHMPEDHQTEFSTWTPESSETWTRWYNKHLKVRFEVRSGHKTVALVDYQNYLNETETITIDPKQTYTLDSWLGSTITLKSLLGRFIALRQIQDNADITLSKKLNKDMDSKASLHLLEGVEYEKKLFLEHHALRHLRILKQPHIVPRVLPPGKDPFIMTKIPEKLFDLLHTYYKKNKDSNRMIPEFYDKFYTSWNKDEVNFNMLHLNEQSADLMAQYISPLAEEWCNCKVRRLTGRGIQTRIRQYNNGARVRFHVDHAQSSHVIGTVLQIAQDLTSPDEKWPFQFINTESGELHSVAMDPGDLLIFESSRMPHARPYALKGTYINTFIYFEVDDLEWSVSSDNMDTVLFNKTHKHHLYPMDNTAELLVTEETDKESRKPAQDEL